MACDRLMEWLEKNGGSNAVWYVKRLSGNDTLANGSHQAGPYITKEFLFDVFPSLNQPDEENPDWFFEARIKPKEEIREVRAVWYNNHFRGGTRNEARLTNFGGVDSALLDPENTGSLAVFSFLKPDGQDAKICEIWVCENEEQEEIIENQVGPVEPGGYLTWSAGKLYSSKLFRSKNILTSCRLALNQIPSEWLKNFPSGAEIIKKTIELRGDKRLPVDKRLINRRACEYEVFQSLEEAIELPEIQKGFKNIEDFVSKAHTILQRRKTRAGKSLELHTRAIFQEERLTEGVHFQYQAESEFGKTPDFLFPNAKAYKDKKFPARKLRMLATKTTCKDRWRQILNEADRIEVKHLLTLQEGVSVNQFREMREAKVKLVVPESLFEKFPRVVQREIKTLNEFIQEIKCL